MSLPTAKRREIQKKYDRLERKIKYRRALLAVMQDEIDELEDLQSVYEAELVVDDEDIENGA